MNNETIKEAVGKLSDADKTYIITECIKSFIQDMPNVIIENDKIIEDINNEKKSGKMAKTMFIEGVKSTAIVYSKHFLDLLVTKQLDHPVLSHFIELLAPYTNNENNESTSKKENNG